MKKNYVREIYKSKEEWLKNRCIGGSSAGVILGVNHWQTLFDLWLSLVKPTTIKDSVKNENITLGIQSEPLIRKTFALNFPKYKVRTPKKYETYRQLDKPYKVATIDGFLIDNDDNRKGIIEIKTKDIRCKSDLSEWDNGIPQTYFAQVIHYLSVINDAQFVKVVVQMRFFNWDSPLSEKVEKLETRFYHIERCDVEKSIKNLEILEDRFWNDYVVSKVPPPIKIKL